MSHKLEIYTVSLNIQKLREMLENIPDALRLWTIKLDDTVRFFDGSEIRGISFKPPSWHSTFVVDAMGKIHFDNYGGNWGDMAEVAKLVSLAQAHEAGGDVQHTKVETDAEGWMTVEVDVPNTAQAGIFGTVGDAVYESVTL